MKHYQQQANAFPDDYLNNLWGEIQACPYFSINNLNRDFIATKGFSVVFQRSGLATVEEQFPYFKLYLDLALQPNCNAFYLNPLQLKAGSRVDPHIDRSLRSYCKTIAPPLVVSVLYVRVPSNMEGGELVLRSHKRQLGQIKPQINTLLYFQGDLTHSVNAVKTSGDRLSLVCEQYSLTDDELEEIPQFTIESRKTQSASKKRKYT
ncbi:iron-regulated protein [Nostoc linckia z18]|uniref:Iron-regulated protein n=2 Tax=Nostoc linckia TaxID=92942 RepID=A0A9Q5ZCD7_NOSLI|nr:2OG-Fe(II) oxygenase [Nostoc linckia]PHK41974.1 iron-regulated protein [Nostoc linckia z15]PHK45599.1 iron-regulated protein [Nostoc linckia z16]PHJ59352.1 iron-regulated protein [Nostoc linckia z1]PHJ62049.1 iron-regulated protein [Nostoc linckia z3]PHJ68419.1 iron-regulated protein [Nostoc linckia z2]